MSFARKTQSRAKLNAQAAFIHKAVPALWRGLLRVSKKWLNATFLSFTGFASRIRSRAAKSAKYENLWVFIRSDAHVVRAGLNIRGCGPLSTPGFFDSLKKSPAGLFFCFSYSVSYFLSPLVQPWTIFVRAKRAMTLGMTMS